MYNSSTLMAVDKMVLQMSAQSLVYYAEGRESGTSDFEEATRFDGIESVIRVARKLHLDDFLVIRERRHVYNIQLEKPFIIDYHRSGGLVATT